MSHAVKTRSEKATLAARRTVCYAALVLLSVPVANELPPFRNLFRARRP